MALLEKSSSLIDWLLDEAQIKRTIHVLITSQLLFSVDSDAAQCSVAFLTDLTHTLYVS